MADLDPAMFASPVVPEGFTRDPSAPGANTTLIVVSGIFFPLAVLFTVGRIYTRAVLVRTVSFDDCEFLYPSCLFMVAAEEVLTATIDLMVAALVR